MLRLVSIDAGKSDTKARMRKPDGSDKSIVFSTRMDPTTNDVAAPGSFITEYANETFIVGRQASTGSAISSKAEKIHRITTYTALHQLVDNNDDVRIVIGCPIAICENKVKKDEYLKFIFPENNIIVTVNGITKRFFVRKAIVAPEGSGVLYIDDSLLKGMVGIIDIGGLNINCCVYDRGAAVISTLFTDNLGSNVFKEGLRKELFKVYGEDIPHYLMDDIIEKGFLPDNTSKSGRVEGSEKLTKEYKIAHVKAIKHNCEQHGWDLKHMPLAFVGGASALFHDEICELLPAAKTYDDPAMLNAKGFLRMIAD